MVTNEHTIISTGVDYVTATQILNGRTSRLQISAAEWLDSERRAGNDVREFTAHGYSGLHSGSVAVSTNGARLLVKLAGTEAQAHAAELIGQADSVSRLDLQTTVRVDQCPLSFAERMERAALRYKQKHHLKFDVDLRRHDRRGKTVYLGARTSERLIRIYDKGRESQLPELSDCWRAECEFHTPLSWSRASQALTMNFDGAWVSQVVQWECGRRGIRWPAQPDRTVNVQPLETLRKPSSADRRISWLRSQVRPTIERLRDAGYLDQALEALGLDHGAIGAMDHDSGS